MQENKLKIRLCVIKRTPFEVICAPRCDNAVRFCQLSRTNTLNNEQIYIIQKLGYEIEIVEEKEPNT
jgi:hypothetical protein